MNPSASGFITAYGDSSAPPIASNLSYIKGQTMANGAIAPVGADGMIDLTNAMSGAGSADLLVDVVGYYGDAPRVGATFVPPPRAGCSTAAATVKAASTIRPHSAPRPDRRRSNSP